jgi:hypothetical protein
MSGPAFSHEPMPRRALRLTLGVSIAFVVSQLGAWPLAMLVPVFAALLLVDAESLPLPAALKVVATFVFALIGGYLVTSVLLPYPAVLVVAAALLLFSFFRFAMTSDVHLLGVVGVALGFVVVPVITSLLPQLAVIAALGFFADVLVALLCAWIAFLLIPAPVAPPDPHHHGPLDPALATALASRMTLVVVPLQVAFLLFGWTSILVLVYAALIATSLGDEASFEMGWEKVLANLVIGGIGMVVFYEMLAAVPSIPFMAVLGFAAFFFYGTRIFGGGPSAGLWVSGFIGFLILTGGALLADGVNTSMKVIDRVMQISVAGLYVFFAYRVIDLVESLFRRPDGGALSGSTPEEV